MHQVTLDGRCFSGARPERRSAFLGTSTSLYTRNVRGKCARQIGQQHQGFSRAQRQITGDYIDKGEKSVAPVMGQEDFDLDVTSGPLPDFLKIGDEIGRGTFGIVHRAVDERSGDNVAVKLLKKRSGPFVNLGRIRNEVCNACGAITRVQDCMSNFRVIHCTGYRKLE